jgi:protease-4
MDSVKASHQAHPFDPKVEPIPTHEVAQALGVVAREILADKKNERRWRNVRNGTIVGVLAVGVAAAGMAYWRTDAIAGGDDKVVAVKIEGVIGERNGSADAIVPALNKAFDDKDVKSIVLAIDSPGGHPGDADRINSVIERRKKETKKEVVAIINGTGGSAAYMIAVHADKIVAGKYSMVGSIGAVIQGWDFHEILNKVGIKSRSFSSGHLKTMLNPYTEMTPDANRKAQEIVDRMAAVFIQEVKDSRKGKLKEGDWFTGEVWPGQEAKDIGLIDEVATIDDYAFKTWGKPVIYIKPELPKPFFSMSMVPEMLAEFVKSLK